MEKKKKILIYAICLASICLCVLSIWQIIQFFQMRKEAKEESNLLNTIEIENTEMRNEENIVEEIPPEIEETEKIETERMLKVKKLQEENADIVGWLEIPDTAISYPVLQGTDNEYYMNHNYKKEKSKSGSIFLNKDYDWTIPSTNLLIYGHNIKTGTMFHDLLKYEKQSFYEEHPIIRFTTEKEDAEYELIAAFRSRVYYKSEKNVFRYYYFIHAETKEEYDDFVSNAKKESLYDIPATAEYGDALITLSTCAYHVKDGRMIVVGKKLRNSN